ncbi:uncharacterized protein J3R85_005342 [Psidium guajava]|nr:uncharacterized protein J3R85_005342 [Psidium guajava]
MKIEVADTIIYSLSAYVVKLGSGGDWTTKQRASKRQPKSHYGREAGPKRASANSSKKTKRACLRARERSFVSIACSCLIASQSAQ